ncbi:uncharacterized protein BDW43DRAFT_297213 [Aspergillus alliaceus]|uniref:uncharacterized protein n=1 Tax=Petromyces alliaceus TaxID=209559 RepID=UPI0012A3BF14|nr:uncharacterized protein BDW43DRAFT_297213 [Aspergillus alliaceus]KAB8237481.1 hypothetical protein BDW43DRAFT_297213 [Aspergillus alliaceus]
MPISPFPGTRILLVGLIAAIYLYTPAISLGTIETSKCIKDCGSSRKTTADDLVCQDSAYNTTEKGKTVKSCLLCQSTGTAYISDERNDIYTFLYNQKYTVQTCLFDRDGPSIKGCDDECLPLRNVYKDNWYQGNNFTPIYKYCDDAGFKQYANKCESCLRGKNGTYILGNFIDTMSSACETKPNASDGEIITLRQPLFEVLSAESSDTEPDPNADSDSGTSSGGLSTGAKAGIGVGAGVGGLLLVGGLVWVLCLKRRSKKVNVYQYERPWQQEGLGGSIPDLNRKDGPASGMLNEMPAEGVVKGPAELPDAAGGNGGGMKAKTVEPVELP